MDRLPSHLHTSPSEILHPTGGRKPWRRLFIVLTGGVQVQKFDGDDGSLLDSGDSFGFGCDVKELENPRRAVVFCDKTSVLEISSELMQFSLELQKSDYVRFLKSTRLFSNMPMQDGFVEELIPLLQIKKFSSNDVIVRWDTTWTEYSQNTTTDALFKNSVESHDTKVRGKSITDTLLADPATILSMMTREEEPRLSWREIRRIRDDELPDRTTKEAGAS